jgi:hypothetical protein
MKPVLKPPHWYKLIVFLPVIVALACGQSTLPTVKPVSKVVQATAAAISTQATAQSQAVVMVENLNLRSACGQWNDTVTVLHAGDVVQLTGAAFYPSQSVHKWQPVIFGEFRGCVNSIYIGYNALVE